MLPVQRILNKYHIVSRDKIYYEKYDINDFTIKDIRKSITYISQNELLYTATIRENIILDRDIDERNFIEVCNLTYVSNIVNDKGVSYDYQLEENGVNLSGGQRQRIVLARSLLKESNIILIDEGLNEIDINLERKILKNIFKRCKDKTIIIVSHRLDNMDLYDMVVKLEKGEIKEVLKKNE